MIRFHKKEADSCPIFIWVENKDGSSPQQTWKREDYNTGRRPANL